MIATGMDTRIGEIAKMMASEDKEAADHPAIINLILAEFLHGGMAAGVQLPSSARQIDA